MDTSKIKLASALLLACCFFMPLTQCSTINPTTQEVTYVFFYPNKGFSFAEMDCYLWTGLFVWPMLAILVRRWFIKCPIYYETAQVILCLISGYYIGRVSLLGKPAVGTYFSFFALIAIFAESLLRLKKTVAIKVMAI